MTLSALAIQKALNTEWEEAVTLNEQILAEDPQNIDALNRLAQAYIHLKELEKANDIYQQVLRIDPFNPIAQRNIVKLKTLSAKGLTLEITPTKPFNFIEEPGKTKIISLVRLGERLVLSSLQPCLALDLHVRSQAVCLYYKKSYVGRLPDDIGKRLIWLCKRDNKYAAFVKSVEKDRVSVFIKETKRSSKNKNYHSFTNSDKNSQAS
ncbi:MAG: tetratricopeptide repeat protein [Patescibacteria group bacterium]|jgi:tetratricopeptide (TPR) repeat protein